MKRTNRYGLALALCLVMAGCMSPSPAHAQTVNLDKRSGHVTKLGNLDTLIATRGNLYHIDTIGHSRQFAATDSQVAALMIDPRTSALYLSARKPGTTDLYYHDSGGKLMRLQIVVI